MSPKLHSDLQNKRKEVKLRLAGEEDFKKNHGKGGFDND